MTHPFIEKLFDFFFPPGPACVACGRMLPTLALTLCPSCREKLSLVSPPVCSKCGKPLRLANASLCFDCSSGNHLFVKNLALGVYDGTLLELVHALKYRRRQEVATPLGVLMAKAAIRHKEYRRGVVVPVPLHPERLAQRGYNQAQLLALSAAKKMDLPLVTAVKRVKKTRFQSELSPEARRRNLEDAFMVTEARGIRGRRIIVVDDVYTTGSTLDAMARALLRHGAAEVYGLCAAVGVRDVDWTGR